MELLAEMDRVCGKHGISYYAGFGTLLGAVRHQGFIPWDDDIDLVMMRPDYERLKEVAREFRPPFFLQSAYTEHSTASFFTIVKLRYDGTMALDTPDPQIHQGIFLDIWPLDAVDDGSERTRGLFDIQLELYFLAVNEAMIRQAMQNRVNLKLPEKTRERLLSLDVRERFRAYESFQNSHFADSQRVNCFTRECAKRDQDKQKRYYGEIVRLPFEGAAVPAPKEYDPLLRTMYNDYRSFVKFGSEHENLLLSPDVSYRDFLEKATVSQKAP